MRNPTKTLEGKDSPSMNKVQGTFIVFQDGPVVCFGTKKVFCFLERGSPFHVLGCKEFFDESGITKSLL
jgi:hypothetical protein